MDVLTPLSPATTRSARVGLAVMAFSLRSVISAPADVSGVASGRMASRKRISIGGMLVQDVGENTLKAFWANIKTEAKGDLGKLLLRYAACIPTVFRMIDTCLLPIDV